MTQQELRVGTVLTPQMNETSIVQVFRYSAATWNTHRIHYDKDYATTEGYPGVLVQSHLHGAFLTKYCTDFVGRDGRLVDLSLRVRKFAVAGESLTVVGTLREVRGGEPGRALVDLDLVETRGSDGETCVEATATLDVPLTWIDEGSRP
ncbi:MAG: hypothetical protein WCF63_06850 [Acidimicrobiales bacterium]